MKFSLTDLLRNILGTYHKWPVYSSFSAFFHAYPMMFKVAKSDLRQTFARPTYVTKKYAKKKKLGLSNPSSFLGLSFLETEY